VRRETEIAASSIDVLSGLPGERVDLIRVEGRHVAATTRGLPPELAKRERLKASVAPGADRYRKGLPLGESDIDADERICHLTNLPAGGGSTTTLGFCCATTMPTPGREVQAEWPGSLMPTASAANPS
jgi:hypothetical protein